MYPTIQLPKVKTGPFVFGKQPPVLARSGHIPAAWPARIAAMFPSYLWYEPSQPHLDMGDWADAIGIDSAPRPFVALWPRGRGKSTWAEMLTADAGARGARLYGLYVSETQDQADKHVGTIQSMLESKEVGALYPEIGSPKIGKHGSRSWRRSLLHAANGFTVEAIGLDKAVRGQKIDWARPDWIVFDDIDAKHDSDAATDKKEGTITTSILPAGAVNCAVLFAQNIIKRNSIAHRLSLLPGATVEGDDVRPADYLADRIVSGPHKAVDGLDYRYEQQPDGTLRWQITAGRSLWQGFTLEVCQDEINRSGPTAFELESQHEIDTDDPNALLTTAVLDATRLTSNPDLTQIAIGVDPSGGTGQVGIIAVGKAKVGRVMHAFTIGDYSTPPGTGSSVWALAALRAYHSLMADVIVVERNFGGDMAMGTIRNAVLYDDSGAALLRGATVPIIEVTASRGKEVRAQPVAALYQQGICHHVGNFPALQKQWTQWIPGTKPSPDRLDAEVWAITYLGLSSGAALPDKQPEGESKWTPAAGAGKVNKSGSKWK